MGFGLYLKGQKGEGRVWTKNGQNATWGSGVQLKRGGQKNAKCDMGFGRILEIYLVVLRQFLDKTTLIGTNHGDARSMVARQKFQLTSCFSGRQTSTRVFPSAARVPPHQSQ